MSGRNVVHSRPYRPAYRRGRSGGGNWRPGRESFNLPNLNWRLVGFIVLALIIIVGWWRLFELQSIQVKGNTNTSTTQLKAMVQTEINKNFWRHNLTTLDTANLAKAVGDDNYQLKTIEIERAWPHGLVVQVSERQPSLVWKTGGQAYLLDADGSIISQINPSSSKLPAVTDNTNLPVKAGDRVVPAAFVGFCQELIGTMAQTTGVGVTGLNVPDTTTEVYVTTNKGYVVKFDTTRTAKEGLAELNRLLVALKTQNKNPAQYIDLRIPNTAYYK